MEIHRVRRKFEKIKMKRYKGTLDYPCDFCDTRSYDNVHFELNDDKVFVVCDVCFDSTKKESDEN